MQSYNIIPSQQKKIAHIIITHESLPNFRQPVYSFAIIGSVLYYGNIGFDDRILFEPSPQRLENPY